MPTFADIHQFLYGQICQTPPLPTASFAGRTIVITGANSGLGLECAKHLVRLKCSKLVLACRSLEKGEDAKKAILAGTPKSSSTSVSVWPVDLTDYQSVLDLGYRICSELPRLDALVANAGVELAEFELAEGTESTLTINVISTFLLGMLVLPKLRESASTYKTDTHLSFVGSMIHVFAPEQEIVAPEKGKIFEALSDQKLANMEGRYFLSKLMVTHLVQEFASRAPTSTSPTENKVIINDVNPGWCATGLFRYKGKAWYARILFPLIGRTGEVGARTLTHAITAGPESHGGYLSECQLKLVSHFVRSAEGMRVQGALWEELVDRLEDVRSGVTSVMQVKA